MTDVALDIRRLTYADLPQVIAIETDALDGRPAEVGAQFGKRDGVLVDSTGTSPGVPAAMVRSRCSTRAARSSAAA